MSHINGKEFGDSHNWEYRGQTGTHNTSYGCKECGEHFAHNYHVIDDIFEAIKVAGVPDKCVKSPDLTPKGEQLNKGER